MEDPEGDSSFDIEGGIEAGHAIAANTHVLGNSVISDDLNTAAPSNGAPVDDVAGHKPSAQSVGKSFRQTVCRHWLRKSCIKGDDCGFLHQYVQGGMPVCRYIARFGECRKQDCIYKHTNDKAKECNISMLTETKNCKRNEKRSLEVSHTGNEERENIGRLEVKKRKKITKS